MTHIHWHGSGAIVVVAVLLMLLLCVGHCDAVGIVRTVEILITTITMPSQCKHLQTTTQKNAIATSPEQQAQQLSFYRVCLAC